MRFSCLLLSVGAVCLSAVGSATDVPLIFGAVRDGQAQINVIYPGDRMESVKINGFDGDRISINTIDSGFGYDDILVGAGSGSGSRVVRISGNGGQILSDFQAFGSSFNGGVSVAGGDVNGDGTPDIITGAGAGGGPHVRVFDGQSGSLLQDFSAFDPSFTGGVFVASGDINGDGVDDIVTGAGEGGGPTVKVFDGASGGTNLFGDFLAFDAGFTGGVRVATGDVNGDGLEDVITGSGPGGPPLVKTFTQDGFNWGAQTTFFGNQLTFTSGIYLSSGSTFLENGETRILVGTGGGKPVEGLLFDQDGSYITGYGGVFGDFDGSASVAIGNVQSVPEPASLTLLGLLGLSVLRKRRRSRRPSSS